MRENMSLALRRSSWKKADHSWEQQWDGLSPSGKEISGKGKNDADGEEGSQGKVLSIVEGSFKDHPTIIPSNNFAKPEKNLKKLFLIRPTWLEFSQEFFI